MWRKLFDEDFVCIARRRHPKLGKRLTLDSFLSLGQVSITPGGQPGTPVDETLARLGRRRRVAVSVPSFLMAPILVASSDLIGVYPTRLARQAVAWLPLTIYPAPFRLEGFSLHLAYHPRHRHDPGHQWFRELVVRVAASVAKAR